MKDADDYAAEARARARAPQELPLRLRHGQFLLQLLEAKTAGAKRAARVELVRVESEMRNAGIEP